MDSSGFLTIQLGAQKEAERWRNRARQTRVSEMLRTPAEADDRSRTGGRCDDRRQHVNSRAQSAAEQQVGKLG